MKLTDKITLSLMNARNSLTKFVEPHNSPRQWLKMCDLVDSPINGAIKHIASLQQDNDRLKQKVKDLYEELESSYSGEPHKQNTQ